MNVNNRTKKPSVGGVGELMNAQRFGPVDAAALVKRLQRPAHPVDVVLDTDAYNEIDDQWARCKTRQQKRRGKEPQRGIQTSSFRLR